MPSGPIGGLLGHQLLVADLAPEHSLGVLRKRAARPAILPDEVGLAGNRTIVGELIGAVSRRQREELSEVEVDRKRGALVNGPPRALVDRVGVGVAGPNPSDGRGHVDEPCEFRVMLWLAKKTESPRRMVGPHESVIGVAPLDGVGNPRHFRVSEAPVSMGPVLTVHERTIRPPIPPICVGVGEQEQPIVDPQCTPAAQPRPRQYGLERHLSVVITGANDSRKWEPGQIFSDLFVLGLSAVVGNVTGDHHQIRNRLTRIERIGEHRIPSVIGISGRGLGVGAEMHVRELGDAKHPLSIPNPPPQNHPLVLGIRRSRVRSMAVRTMIRRYYVLPLMPGVPDEKVQEMIDVLNAADRFIPGLLDSSAGVNLDSRTVLWENTFVDEASYSGPYMVHPYHIGAIDNYVMPDSPECITDNTYATRYTTSDAAQEVRGGIRRVLLLNVANAADASALEALAGQPQGMAASAFGADDVGWVSAKGRPWTHVWEQAFNDMAQLERYLGTSDGMACSSLEGFASLGIDLGSLKIFTCPFNLSPVEHQSSPAPPQDTAPVLYTITARTAAADADAYVGLLECHYDRFMVEGGCPLLNRWRTVDQGYLEAEVRSTWQIDSLSAYSDLRATTFGDPHWTAFVKEAMPLVQGGSRRFQREV